MRATKAPGNRNWCPNVTGTRGSSRMVAVDTFRDDPMFPRIERVVAELLHRGNVVAPVDVIIGIGLLRREHLDDWRSGRVPYLERVIDCNLTRPSRLLLILRFHAHDLKLKPSVTVYMRHGKGPKQRLRFIKTGDAKLEQAYFVRGALIASVFEWERATITGA